MSDLQLSIVHDPADARPATDLVNDLRAEIARRSIDPSDRPDISARPGLDQLPDLDKFGTLSLVLVVLPDPGRNGFSLEEKAALNAFRKKTYPDNRLVPIAMAQPRDRPPSPLDDIKSFPLHGRGGVQGLTTLLLNLLCLRLAGGKRKLFVSYRISDGTPWAQGIADGLRQRGYDVWRDDDPDRDNLPMITPGTPAQTTIRDAILGHGFVLVVDTMDAPLSAWVHTEIATAVEHLLPMLPVVIEGEAAPADHRLVQVPPAGGGRFLPLRELGREERITVGERDNSPGNPAAVLDDPFFDRLERKMNDVFLGQLRSRRRLLHEVREKFQRRGFQWLPLQEARLLYRASLSRDSDLTPGLELRFLVQCAPYDSVLDQTVANVCEHFHGLDCPHQYAALVHQAAVYPAQKRALLRGRGEHVMILHTDEIDDIPSIFKL